MKNKVELKNNFFALLQLTKRNFKIFLSDKAGVFFSLLAPLIVLVLYVLFLGDVQVQSVTSAIPEGVVVDEKAVRAYVDSWMVAGVLSVACITVAFSANLISVVDKSNGTVKDGLSSPIWRSTITLSYFLYNFLVTSVIVTIVFALCLIYLAANGGWYMSAGDVFGCFGTILYSSLSATLLTVFICGFIKTESQHGAVVGIISAVIGFFIGAYMPMSIMPKFVQYVSAVIPGSHSSGLFKHYLMSGPLDNLAELVSPEMSAALSESFSMEINFFGKYVGVGVMALYLGASIILFLALNLFFAKRKKEI